MGSTQSEIIEYDELKRKYGMLKTENNELMERMESLDKKSNEAEQVFKAQCEIIDNKINNELHSLLQKLKHEFSESKRQIDDNQSALKDRLYEVNNSINEIKLSEMRIRNRRSSFTLHRRS